MTIHTNPTRVRGIKGVRAEGDVNTLIADINRAVKAMREEYDIQIKNMGTRLEDVVQNDKVERINATITDLQKHLDELTRKQAAAGLGGGGATDPVRREHKAAFESYFRTGAEAGLKDLAVRASLTTQSKPDGGYLVPEEMSATIDRVLGVTSVMRQLAMVVPVGGAIYKKIMNMGGATSGWVGEEEERSDTGTPSLRELEYPTMELYAKPLATQTMLDDGIVDIAAWLADEVNITFSEQEGLAFVSGNGVKKPRGILAYDKVANASYAWGKVGYVASGDANGFDAPEATVSPADAMIDCYHALKQGYRQNASWLMSDLTGAAVRKFKNADGDYIWAPPSAATPVGTILGKPVNYDDNMPSVAAGTFPVAFADFRRAYLITDRSGVVVLRDPYTAQPYVKFYTTKRVGGGIANFEAIKLLKIGTS